MKEYIVRVRDAGYNTVHTEWRLNDKLHREDGPAIEYPDGSKEWFLNGNLHREDGPAVECASGYKAWYFNGQRHREDGPAREWANGRKKWYLNDVEYTEEEWKTKVNPKLCLGKKVVFDGVEYTLS